MSQRHSKNTAYILSAFITALVMLMGCSSQKVQDVGDVELGKVGKIALKEAKKRGNCFLYVSNCRSEGTEGYKPDCLEEEGGFIWYYHKKGYGRLICLQRYEKGKLLWKKELKYYRNFEWLDKYLKQKDYVSELLNTNYKHEKGDPELYYFCKDSNHVGVRMIPSNFELIQELGYCDFLEEVATDVSDYRIVPKEYWKKNEKVEDEEDEEDDDDFDFDDDDDDFDDDDDDE